jgi:exopolyphosphatase / guanosine-5'-triphosphate,3'-diphosphate pyrophosphatase
MPVLAAIDIGSNSVRLKIARLSKSRVATLYEDREVTRLGEGVFRDGALAPEGMALTVSVLERFRRACDRYKAQQVRVVATSATRDARNSEEFAAWVKSATGWDLEVISGLEEGRLIHLGVAHHSRLGVDRVLFFDLGGGSCEVTLAEEGHIRHVVSLPLGAVRLTQEFIKHDPPTADEVRRMTSFVHEELARVAAPVYEFAPELTIATSGSAAALHKASRVFEQDSLPLSTTSRKAVSALKDHLATLKTPQRAALPGINARRAEIIMAGATVFSELLRTYELPSFRYSPLGLRDGLIAQMAADLDQATREHRAIEVERADALRQMAERYAVDLKYATHVRQIAQQLFTGMERLHGLSEDYLPYLTAAAMLHECGYFVARNGRHRHTWYLIAHSEIFGFDAYERLLIAAIARFMGKSRPTPEDRILKVLQAEDRTAVPKLVALLRLARALNQSRQAAIRHVSVISRPKAVHLHLARRSKRLGELELWAAEKERPDFQSLFDRELRLVLDEE